MDDTGTQDIVRDIVCSLCGNSFDLRRDFDSHLLLMHSDHTFFQDAKRNSKPVVVFEFPSQRDCSDSVKDSVANHLSNIKPQSLPCVNESIQSLKSSSVTESINYVAPQGKMSEFEPNGNDAMIQPRKTRKGSFPCDVCTKSYTRKHDMLKHKKIHLQDNKATENNMDDFPCDERSLYPFSCDVCGRKYSRKHDMSRHMKQHSTDVQVQDGDLVKAKVTVDGKTMYRCDECNEHVGTRYGFVRHLRIHTGEKPFSCHVCGKQFRISLTLYRHIREVHERVRNYPCDVCGRRFANSHSRNDHRRIHTNERPCVCHVCGKAFKTKASLFVHSKFHSNVFSHHCSHCGKGFHMKQNLTEHVLMHTGEKPHSCHVCPKSFRTSNQLKNHILIHTNKESYQCSVCGKHFAQERYLKNHARCYRGHTIN